MPQDSQRYREKKAFFDNMLTIYGRKPVLEALQDATLSIYKVHLADSNKPADSIDQMLAICQQRNIPVSYHSKQKLSRISRNSKQDQGVAADITLENYQPVDQFLNTWRHDRPFTLIALDSITNPQNLGMIIRSVCAGHVDGLIIPKQGCAALSPLVIKASAGTVFKTNLIHCNKLIDALPPLKQAGATLITLAADANTSLFEQRQQQSAVYILGNETEGVSQAINELSDLSLSIPMNNQVESLNVAVTAALIAFYHSSHSPPPAN